MKSLTRNTLLIILVFLGERVHTQAKASTDKNHEKQQHNRTTTISQGKLCDVNSQSALFDQLFDEFDRLVKQREKERPNQESDKGKSTAATARMQILAKMTRSLVEGKAASSLSQHIELKLGKADGMTRFYYCLLSGDKRFIRLPAKKSVSTLAEIQQFSRDTLTEVRGVDQIPPPGFARIPKTGN